MTTLTKLETPSLLVPKGRVLWASLAALGGCAALCSLPLLATLLGGGAVATALTRLVSPGAELIAGGLTFVGVLGFLGYRAARRGRRAAEIPIACDPLVFSKDERTAHHELAKNVIVRWPLARQELPDGYEFRYEGDEARFLELARWVASEHRCCAWASFSLEMDPFTSERPGAIRLRMRGGAEGKGMLGEAFALLAGDRRIELFSNPTGKISPEAFRAAKQGGHGCGC